MFTPRASANRKRETVALFLFVIFLFPAFAQAEPLARFAEKISPVLRDQVELSQYEAPLSIIVQVRNDFFVRNEERRRADGTDRDGNALRLVSGYTARLTPSQIKILLASDFVEYVTLDVPITPSSANVQLDSIGADPTHVPGLTGYNVAVALFDSGINPNQDLINGRIRAAVDFTSGALVWGANNRDGYGHGTHVAGIIGGTGKLSGGKYAGVAPDVDFIDVKVIDDNGSGSTSNLIKAIDWVIQKKDVYQIRVANLSLGHAPVESYVNDPLCKAVERLVASGVVTVVSAGNLGKTSQYPKIWGAINSPGNSPSVITVGPINTRGTATHSDDIATTYGSRGATYVDRLFKPDLSAPGNAIVSLAVPGSYIQRNFPSLAVDSNYMRLSGASMATAFVSGTAALMAEANAGLQPSAVKMALLVSAVKLQQPHMLEQGNGLVNAKTATDLARALDASGRKLSYPVSPAWLMDFETVWAGGAVATGNRILYGQLVNPAASPVWGGGTPWSTTRVTLNSIAWTDGFFSSNSIAWTDSITWSDSTVWTHSIIWSDSMLWTDSMLWSDSIIWSDSIVWTDSMLWSDSLVWSDKVFAGDMN